MLCKPSLYRADSDALLGESPWNQHRFSRERPEATTIEYMTHILYLLPISSRGHISKCSQASMKREEQRDTLSPEMHAFVVVIVLLLLFFIFTLKKVYFLI